VARTEYYDDPSAPTATRIVVAAVAFVQDHDGRALLVERSDNGLWALPGGVQEIGETVAAAAERETLEETGYRVTVNGLIGIYSDPKHVIAYSDGEVRQQFAIAFRAELRSGAATTSGETPSVGWFSEQEAAELSMHPSIRLRVDHGFARLAQPYLG
jgi:ADP-ribose pyrophosphatase YjhB (NUDIX family)